MVQFGINFCKREIINKVLNSMDEHVHGFMDDNVCVVELLSIQIVFM